MNIKVKVIISGGGTGGHIFPAIAIAKAIQTIQPDAEILFVGAKGRMEMEKVPKAGYPIEGLWISGFQRKLTVQNLLFPLKLLSSLTKARRIVKRFQPDVAVGVGGYASGPTLQMAAQLGIPCLIQEQNSYAGATNRLLAKKVQKICVAYDKMERYFPKEKIRITGNPVRNDLINNEATKAQAADYFTLNVNKKTILIIGGSLGARTLNQAMAESTEWLRGRTDVQVLWQCGSLYYEEYKNLQTSKLPNVLITAFIDRMDLAYRLADVAIARAGALTVSELCLVGKPAILVPSPNVTEDHQTKNAMALVEKDAAILLKDADAKLQMIPKALQLLDDNNFVKEKLAINIQKLAKPNAAAEIAGEVLKLVKGNR
jgi:UDP-N-acetylglucosamine--N-acetylmuramyl-(pentapeptide) pyrophosphoryl-undecaprenol N-acetylglucosamine transferase